MGSPSPAASRLSLPKAVSTVSRPYQQYRTFANIPQILAKGAEWYKSLGLGDAAGTKLYSLSGDVLNPGLYELPMGTTLQSLIYDHGGGMLEGRTFKAVFTGGRPIHF